MKPTIGRIVLLCLATAGVVPAIVTRVWNDTCIDVCAFPPDGSPFPQTSVVQHQGDPADQPINTWAWMPYQVGQAAKTEEAERALLKVAGPGSSPFAPNPTVTDGFSFMGALSALKGGEKVARLGWNGKGMWLALQVPDENSKMTHPYIYIEYPVGHPAYPKGSRVPWLASQTDLLADDWTIAS